MCVWNQKRLVQVLCSSTSILDITGALASETNSEGIIINYDLDIFALLLHKAILLSDTSKVTMAMP